MKSSLRPLALIAASLFLALGARSASASPITFTANSSGPNGPQSASAVFTVTSGQIQVTVSNTLAAGTIVSSGQNVSGFSFTLSNAAGALGSTAAQGQLGDVSGSGQVTYVTGSPTRFLGAGGKGKLTVAGDKVSLEALGGGKPNQMIAPNMTNGGAYADANNGFQQFDPYTIGSATFTLDLSGVTAGTTITGVTFSFGTGSGDTLFKPFIPSPPTPTPEPTSLWLLGTGCLGIAALLRRRIFFRA